MQTNVTEADHSDIQAQIDALQHALSRSVDARAGYDVMVDKAEPEFRSVAQRFRETHYEQADRLGAIIVALGGEPDRDGGVMSTVNKAVVSLRAMFDEIDEDVMDSIRDGEAHVLEALDDAIATLPDNRHRTDVRDMRAELQKLLDETRHLD